MLKKELEIFLVVGLLTVALDFSVYRFLAWFINIDYSKFMGFFAGSIFSFFVNKHWTFNKKNFQWLECIKFLGLYTFSCLVNVTINTYLVFHLPEEFRIFIAFLLATGASTVINFIGMKWFVFDAKKYMEILE
jgi:putative flippase GtrA